ncbi:hypothetical protein EVAR_83504_1 [Eumeta japonica]|uniref:Uncharacterized protein n=1 Tax=Eumeta variegata TaxID=151549 RepID=A0A4C1XXR7_EUMVA|nr:hypothetical protein EVAR_83504_1 [Eumeta japonica]
MWPAPPFSVRRVRGPVLRKYLCRPVVRPSRPSFTGAPSTALTQRRSLQFFLTAVLLPLYRRQPIEIDVRSIDDVTAMAWLTSPVMDGQSRSEPTQTIGFVLSETGTECISLI